MQLRLSGAHLPPQVRASLFHPPPFQLPGFPPRLHINLALQPCPADCILLRLALARSLPKPPVRAQANLRDRAACRYPNPHPPSPRARVFAAAFPSEWNASIATVSWPSRLPPLHGRLFASAAAQATALAPLPCHGNDGETLLFVSLFHPNISMDCVVDVNSRRCVSYCPLNGARLGVFRSAPNDAHQNRSRNSAP